MAFAPKVQTFVPELLSEIFLECLPEETSAQIRHNAAPLSVSRVCRHWRNISLSTNRLWASLYLCCDDNEVTRDHALPTLREFLQRSGTADFRFKLVCYQIQGSDTLGPEYVDWSLIEIMFHELEIHAVRIKDFTLVAAGPIRIGAAQFLRRGALPALDYLSLDLLRDIGDDSISFDNQFWRSISSLRSLHFGSGYQFGFECLGDVGCPGLQELVLSDTRIDGHDLLRILDGCPTLETLYFRTLTEPSTDWHEPERRSFPSITCLEVVDERGTGYDSICFLLDHIKLPNLRYLFVKSYELPETSFKNFLLSSKPPVEELELAIEEPTDDQKITFLLSELPSLKKLLVPYRELVARQLILPAAGDKIVCPLLEEITLGIEGTVSEKSIQAWTAAGDMILSRWRPPKGRLSVDPDLDTSAFAHDIRSERSLRKIVLPHIWAKQRKRQELNKSIRDCQREGLYVRFHAEHQMISP